MAMHTVVGVAPSTLLRALRKHAALDHDDDDADDAQNDLLIGVLLGVKQSVENEESASQANSSTRVTLFGLLNAETDLADAVQYLPGGVAPVGHFAVLQRAVDDAAIEECAQRVGEQRVQQHDGFVLVYVRSSETARLFQVSSAAGALLAVDLAIVECLHAQDFLRATGCALVRCALDVNAPSAAELGSEVQRWTTQLSDPEQVFFRVASGKPVFDGDGVNVTTGATSDVLKPLSALLKVAGAKQQSEIGTSKAKKNSTKKKTTAQAALNAWDDEATSKRGLNTGGSESESNGYIKTLEYGEITNIELLCSLAPSPSSGGGLAAAPLLTIPDSNAAPSSRSQAVHLHADTLMLVPSQTTVAHVLNLVRERLSEQLAQLENHFHSSAGSSNAVHAHHYALIGAAFPLTVITASAESKEDVQHQKLYESFLQPLNQPLFRADRCSLVKKSELLSAADVLFNVHEGIPSSGVVQGKQFLVDGFYGYYHYMQQSMNDKGWGCAYRSLQTLTSWLHLNHYTDKASLSHKEIQQTLVKIGDKPASFVNSREWIGSMEVGYVLDELFGVSFRNLNVPSGPRLVEKAQELKHHFETQGTPVMMGGGNLAFTLLGIDYNESTGDCAFLILDPHYTGGEDLSVIQTKPMALEGYKAIPCGWRKATTFAKSFYNLCLPQRPQQES